MGVVSARRARIDRPQVATRILLRGRRSGYFPLGESRADAPYDVIQIEFLVGDGSPDYGEFAERCAWARALAYSIVCALRSDSAPSRGCKAEFGRFSKCPFYPKNHLGCSNRAVWGPGAHAAGGMGTPPIRGIPTGFNLPALSLLGARFYPLVILAYVSPRYPTVLFRARPDGILRSPFWEAAMSRSTCDARTMPGVTRSARILSPVLAWGNSDARPNRTGRMLVT